MENSQEVPLTKEQRDIQKTTAVIEPVVSIPYVQNKFLEAKKEFLANSEVTLQDLAEKFKISIQKLLIVAKEQNWESQRADVYAKADTKIQSGVADRLAEVNEKHVSVSKFVMNLAIQAMREHKKNPAQISPKDALAYLVASVKMQREALGMAKEQPKIVNIITQQQSIINKYRKSNASPDAQTVVVEGEENG